MVTERASRLISFISDAGGRVECHAETLHLWSVSGHLLTLPLPVQPIQVSLIRTELQQLGGPSWFCALLEHAVTLEDVLECYAELLLAGCSRASVQPSDDLLGYIQHPPAVESWEG